MPTPDTATEPSPTLEQWRGLFTAADAFRKLAPWKWTSDSQLFAVKDPAEDRTGYCSVLGEGGEVFGLAAYLGADGLGFYRMIQSSMIQPEVSEVAFHQRCLLVTFGPRNELQPPDLQIVKDLGLKPKGRKGWPLFRSYRPGCPPWFLTQAEAVFFTRILEQSTGLCSRLSEDPELLIPYEEDLIFTRVRVENSSWADRWLEREGFPEDEGVAVAQDKARLTRIARAARKKHGTWETDLFYSPLTVTDRDRPYFPRMVLFVDGDSGLVLAADTLPPEKNNADVILEAFLDLAERSRALPRVLEVLRLGAQDALKPVAKKLGVKVWLKDDLPMLEEAKTSFLQAMSTRR
jgi:Domain of unknown function (DUF6930)